MKRGLIVLLAYVFSALSSIGQPFCTVKTFNLRDGLASNSVTGITQTPDHLIWISTWNGLSSFDGYGFFNFRDYSDKGRVLTTNRLLNIQPGKNNNLWCVTYDLNPYIFNRKQCEYIDISKLIRERFNTEFHTMRALPMSNGKTWLMSTEQSGPAFLVDDNDYLSEKGIKIFYDKKHNNHDETLKWVWEDNKQRQWLITDKRISIHNGHYKSELPFSHITQVGDVIFLASNDGHLSRFSEKEMVAVPIPIPSAIHEINRLLDDGDKRVIAITDAGIYVYDSKSNKGKLITLPPLSFASGKVEEIMPDSKGRIWVATDNNGILLIEDETIATPIHIPQMPLLRQSNVSFFHEDKYHTVWAATDGGFFGYYDETRKEMVSSPIRTYTMQPFINKFYFDSQGNMWYTGEHNLSIANFGYNNLHQVTGIQEVRSTLYDHTGRLWVGTLTGEVIAYTPKGELIGYLGKDCQLHKQPSRFSSHIYCLAKDSQHRLWIGTKGDGLYSITTTGQMRHYLHDDNDVYTLPSNQVYDVHEDHQHRIWVGTFEKGICLLQDDRFIHGENQLKGYPISDFHKVRRITETKEGVIIVSASNGLVTFSEKFSHPSDIHFHAHKYVKGDTTSLMTSDVMQTFVSSNGTIYVATVGGGVQQIADKNLLQDHLKFRRLAPLSDCGIVLNIEEDNNKNLWIGCENSINMYDPKSKQMWRFGPGQIGENTEMTEAKSSYSHQTGFLTVATNDGFVSFIPERLKEEPFVPPLVFYGIQFHGDQETRLMPANDSLEVPANRRNLTVYFSALDYQDNYLIEYCYKLEGVDRNWNFIGKGHSISFNNLPHGHHRLLVRSTNSFGQWIDNTRVLHIYAHPTFWETWWAKLLYALLFLGLVGVAIWIYRLYTINSIERKLNNMKTAFFTDISHKLRTPLTLIGAPITQVLSSENLSETATKHLEMVRRNAQRMLDLVNKMLKYSLDHNTYISDEDAAEANNALVMSKTDTSNRQSNNDDDEDNRTRLLIVEDNEDLLDFLVSILEKEYIVRTATNGREGIKRVQEEQPDFILTDVMMPEMNGLEMVHHIKADPDTSHIPIIILSAKASIDDRIEGLKAGVNDYITKPFSATYLKQRMQNIIANQRLLQQNYLENIRAEATTDRSAQQEDKANDRQTLRLKSTKIVDSDKQMMEQLVEYIEDNLSNPDLMIEDLAKAVCLGRTAFFNKVKGLVGMSPVELLRRIRIQHAEEMVAKSNEPFSQIAYAVGFSDSRYFGKCFKKQTGLTPSEYREHSKATEDHA